MGEQRGRRCPCICATIRMAARSVTVLYDEALRESGLRATQFHLLFEVESARETTVTRLTKRMLVDQTTLTRNIGLLEKRGLLEVAAGVDRRVKQVRLTEAGRERLQAAKPLWAEVQERVRGMMGPMEWERLGSQLDRLAESVGAN